MSIKYRNEGGEKGDIRETGEERNDVWKRKEQKIDGCRSTKKRGEEENRQQGDENGGR